jgi:DinB superfamily
LNSSLETAFEKLERQRSQIINRVKDLPEQQFTTAPPGKWSIAQILMHLLASERLSVAYMTKKSLGIDTLKDSGLKQSVLSVLLNVSQRIPALKFKAPKVVVENTPAALPLEELISQWDKSRANLKQLLESIPERHSRKLIYKHPIAGMLNVQQAVKFMYEHVHHHSPQIKSLLKS